MSVSWTCHDLTGSAWLHVITLAVPMSLVGVILILANPQSNPEVRSWMAETGLETAAAVEEYFENRVLALAAAAGRSYIVWQVWIRGHYNTGI